MTLANRRRMARTLQWAALLLAGGAVGYGCVNHRRSRALKRKFLAPHEAAPQSAPQPGDILLFHNARGTNNIASWLTGSPFYHVGIYAGDGKAVEARPRGVVHDTLRDRLHDFMIVPAPEGKGSDALNWAESKVGDPYDKVGLAIIFLEHIFTHLHLNYTPGNRFTCGEFVATAFDRAGVRLFPDRDLDDVTPADFARLLPAAAIPRH
jgi:uncharacterized protein YycO